MITVRAAARHNSPRSRRSNRNEPEESGKKPHPSAQGRGGLSKAKVKFGVSFPTLARWVKQAESGKGASKVKKSLKQIGRAPKTAKVPSGHVLISKKVLKEFQKGIANLEAAFGAISNALRVLE